MKIALAHFRVGETDGVSLEMEKWKLSFERMGHEVMFLAGSQGTTDVPTHVIEELHYQHPQNNKFVKNAYDNFEDYESEQAFKQDILSFAEKIEQKLISFIRSENIDLVVPNNIWSLGWGLPAGIAFTEAAKKTGIRFLAHHHDFYWERERYSNPTCLFVNEMLLEYFPPDLPNVTHVVINHIAKQELWERRQLKAIVVPNVFDFSATGWHEDEYNKDFRSVLGVGANDILVLQATRIAERKAIELGIEFVAELQKLSNEFARNGLYNGKPFDPEKDKIVYILAGLPEASAEYMNHLQQKAEEMEVDLRFVNEYIDHSRNTAGGKKVYSLWDAYVFADFITYPSILEGWGNQLLEGVFARKPMMVYEYPVFVTDIKDKNFYFSSLGSEHEVLENGLVTVDHKKVEAAADGSAAVLADSNRYETVTSHNFEVAKKYYSYEALDRYLSKVVRTVEMQTG